jgi:GH25 family lysozyme M1 (1,4-beta-N-acetylmuramidase)
MHTVPDKPYEISIREPDGSFVVPSIELFWDDIPGGADSYEVEFKRLSDSPNHLNLQGGETLITSRGQVGRRTSADIEEFDVRCVGCMYCWRVRAYKDGQWSEFSKTMYFNIMSATPTTEAQTTKYVPSSYLTGIDVSKWQGQNFPWDQIINDPINIKFSFIRISYATFPDDVNHPNLAITNIQKANAVGLLVLPYHCKYYYPGYPRVNWQSTDDEIRNDARAEAQNFWMQYTLIEPYLTNGKFQPALDIENGDINSNFLNGENDIDKLTGRQKLILWIDTWIDYVKQKNPNFNPIIYTSNSGANEIIKVKNYENWWIARYGSTLLEPSIPWDFWQYQGGIKDMPSDWDYIYLTGWEKGELDLDYFKGDENTLKQKFLINPSPSGSESFQNNAIHTDNSKLAPNIIEYAVTKIQDTLLILSNWFNQFIHFGSQSKTERGF